jgi:hypothetical protein
MTVSASGDWTGRLYPDRLLRAGGGLVLRGGEPWPAGGDAPLSLAAGEPPRRGRDGSLSRA